MPRPWLNIDPKSENSLFFMDRLMMDCLSPTFPSFLSKHKSPKKRTNLTFYSCPSSRVSVSCIKMGANSPCFLLENTIGALIKLQNAK